MRVRDLNSHRVNYPSMRRLPFPCHLEDIVANHAFEVHQVKEEIIDFLADDEANDIVVVPDVNEVPIDNVLNGDTEIADDIKPHVLVANTGMNGNDNALVEAENGGRDENPMDGEMAVLVQVLTCEKLLTQYQARSSAMVFIFFF